ncbi:MAG: branched-chain amino acid ABC transporter permease [Oscillospiraceae bacterium]|nr:branched-chain amino acid ABC transporter permease [Oscillospiraceae bacterium]
MWNYIEGILCLALISVISVLGLTVFTGFTGMFSMGHAAFIAIGAYTASILTSKAHANFYLALALGGLMSGFVSLIIGYPTLRAKLQNDYFAIATLGFGEAVRVILENLKITNGARGLVGIPARSTFLNILLITVLLTIITAHYVYSKYGRQSVAIREDHVAAEMMGINLFTVRLRALFFSAVMAGIGGGLYAHYVNFIQPSMFTSTQSTTLIAAVVAGGMGSITGPFVAMLIFSALPEILRVADMWRLVAYGLILVLIMVLRPQGIFGYKELNFKFVKRWIKKIRAKKPALPAEGGDA